jgi:two-component system, NtrC family, response regulator HydG
VAVSGARLPFSGMSRAPALVARSKAMRTVLDEARRYALAEANVLLIGETGVGKDALARLMHQAGPRRKEPFLVVDCAGLPASLVEAELFGHERGAFTDATVARAGRFEAAGRGTVYLDAVSALSPDAQGAILRVVEEKRVTRLGAAAATDVRARIISSAEATIEDAVREGTFRTDLFHRLGVLPLVIPPLRERPEDIVPMARSFLAALARDHGRATPVLTPDAEDALLRYHWPGNSRELRHTLERMIVAGIGERITAADLPLAVLEGDDAYLAPAGKKRPTLEEVERRYIELVLRDARGNQTRAAAILGISRKALWEKRKRYGIE